MPDQVSNTQSAALIPWVSIFIPTRNESRHIVRCINSAQQLTPHIYVIDSHSDDDTTELATALGAVVYSVTCATFAEKLNWTLDNIDFPTPWVMRMDADEVLTETLIAALPGLVATVSPEVSGLYLRRQLWFMGQWIRYGGMYPTHTMRVWKKNLARCEVRILDEHMVLVEGSSYMAALDIIDNPLIDLNAWSLKHNMYSNLEVRELFSPLEAVAHGSFTPRLMGNRAERVRWLKLNIFNRIPLFIRPWLYFLYRYFIRLGFLDGRKGFIFHFMHGLWYRMLVDAKIFEEKLRRLG